MTETGHTNQAREGHMFWHTAIAAIGLSSFGGGTAGPTPAAHVQVDAEPGRVVVTIGPLHIAAGTHYHHEGAAEHAGFTWPEDGWIQGYRIDVLDASAAVMPRETIHHAGVANLSRRQLAYPTAQRLFAVGRETHAVTLPDWMGMRMSTGEELIAYFALVNESGTPVEGASLRITLDWRPARVESLSSPSMFVGRGAHPAYRFRRWESGVTEVVPLVLNANPNQGGETQFDVGPGISVVSTEVVLPLGGYLRVAGGHMHDYASEMRLEEVETGEVLIRLEAERKPDGRLIRVEEERFPFKLHGVRLEAGRRYRVVGVYDNPTGELLPKSGMAYLAGAFIPDDMDAWPELETDDARYARDLAGITGEEAPHGHAAP
ncbi:MAG: hypothetical protein PVJ80_04480 [Gemmatimonadota bacterium]